MSIPSQGTSGPSGHIGLQPAPAKLFGGNSAASQPAWTQTSPEQSMANQIRALTRTVETFLELHQESSVTKDQIDGLLKGLDRLGLGADDGNVVHNPRSIRSDALLISLGRIKDKLVNVSDRLENMGCMGSAEDGKVVSELTGDINSAVSDCQSVILAASAPGELPPPAPRACFGRDEEIEKIVGLAENLEPMALIGAGGIGKTSIALTVLHNSRVKQRFRENRRFVRCDQFPATLSHFLSRLSEVTGAGIENPDNLAHLFPFLSSKEIFIVLDNAESILDPQGTDAREIYASVEELCQLETICVCITSRISTVPPDCEELDIPTLSMEAARDVFYQKYKRCGRSGLVDHVLRQLEFHPLSVTLLATVAQQNRWDVERLVKEWEGRRTDTLRTEHQTSLGTTIEVSLDSPMFKELGPDARDILGVIAFYPQGIDEKNIEWLFPTVSNRNHIFDKLCILSLTHRSNGFVTMLAPLRDHLRPQHPMSSPLLCTTKECYFAWMSVGLEPELHGPGDGRWIVSEDVNVEHLIAIFTAIDPDSDEIWDAFLKFVGYLEWYKPRQTLLRAKIEALPDDHRYKSRCLLYLGSLFNAIGNYTEEISLLKHALKLERGRGDSHLVGLLLRSLADANRMLNHSEEGIHQAREASEVYERLGDNVERALCMKTLAGLLWGDGQVDAAEEVIFESITLHPEEDREAHVCGSHQVLGHIYRSKGNREKAMHHYEVALGIASTFSWSHTLFGIHISLALLLLDEDYLDGAQIHLERAKSLVIGNTFHLALVAIHQARIWSQQRRFEDAASEVLYAREMSEKHGFKAPWVGQILEKLGFSDDPGRCKVPPQNVGRAMESLPPSGDPDIDAHGPLSSTSADAPRDPDHASQWPSHP